MPELPEVQTIIEDIQKKTMGRTIREITFVTPSVWRNGVPDDESIAGSKIVSLERKGKHILMHLSNKRTLIIHLKMTGKLVVGRKNNLPEKHTHLIVRFDRGELRFNDIRRFGYLDYAKSSELGKLEYLAALGPDAKEIPKDEFVRILKSKSKMIKAALLDQNLISGMGNIYTDETLFAAGVHPARKSSNLSIDRLRKLHAIMNTILDRAIIARGSSISDYVDGIGRKGKFQKSLKVYSRAGRPCPKCGAAIRVKKIAGRSSYFCPQCQR